MTVHNRRVTYRTTDDGSIMLIDIEDKTIGTIPAVYAREAIAALVRHELRQSGQILNLSGRIEQIAEQIDALIMRLTMEFSQ